jgi:RND family efflux transporter MFP subunit
MIDDTMQAPENSNPHTLCAGLPAHRVCRILFLALLCFGLCALAPCASAAGTPVEGFTEPYRTVEVASAETGVLLTLLVQEGDHVKAGQPLATLDDDLQRSQVAIAEQQAENRGRRSAAEAELALHQRRHEKLVQLREAGQAYAEETARALADVRIAESKLLAEQEEQKLSQRQLEKFRLQLLKRTIVAPGNGVVVEVHRQVGEIVSPAMPQVVKLVTLDPLKATFLLTAAQLARLKPRQKVRVTFVDNAQTVEGLVEMIAPITDAESGTTGVRVRIANPELKLRSGERCRLELP